jgi:hypothetical protein
MESVGQGKKAYLIESANEYPSQNALPPLDFDFL